MWVYLWLGVIGCAILLLNVKLFCWYGEKWLTFADKSAPYIEPAKGMHGEPVRRIFNF